MPVPGIELRREAGVDRIAVEPSDSYRLELENVSDAIRGDGLGNEWHISAAIGESQLTPLQADVPLTS